MQTDLTSEQIPEWVDTLQWAVTVMPSGYERQRGVIEAELDNWQFFYRSQTPNCYFRSS